MFGHHKWIKPRNTRQYLYKITPSFWPSPKVARDGNVRMCLVLGFTALVKYPFLFFVDLLFYKSW